MVLGQRKNYLVTAAQFNSPVHRNFLRGLESYASDIDAELLVLTMRERIHDDIFPRGLEGAVVVPEGGTFRLNSKVHADNYHIRPQQIDPVTGLARFTQSDVTTLFASPKQRLKVVPNSNNRLPKILMTTGAVTKPNYRRGFRISDIARRDHVYGAVIVELENNVGYHFRQLQANSRGHFVDLGRRYEGDGGVKDASLEAMVLGDLHVGEHDPKVIKATYEMITELQPKRVVLHDFFNGHSVNHHDDNNLVARARRFGNGQYLLEQELSEAADFLKELVDVSNGAEIVIVASNHDEFLNRYLQEGRFVKEPHNIVMASRLLPEYIAGENPVKKGVEMFYDIPDNVQFLDRDQDYKVRGWQLGAHGDKGGNGSRGSIRQRENSYGKSITAHSHSPEIQRNTWVVGTSTHLDLDYLSGPSGWMNTHALLYDTGKTQLVNIINGRWRRKE